MTDVLTKEQRSYNMSRIKSKNTKVENILANKMKNAGIKFINHPKIFGKPDFLILDKKIVVFVDGCFWHKCPKHYKKPKTEAAFWKLKIKRNVERDREVTNHLKKEGYKVIRFWEHEVETVPKLCIKRIA